MGLREDAVPVTRMKRRRVHSFFAFAVVAAVLALAAPAFATTIDVLVGPLTTTIPHSVTVIGTVSGDDQLVWVQWGDGASHEWSDNGAPMPSVSILQQHAYECPGTYQILVGAFDGVTFVHKEWQVTVGYPTPLPLKANVTGGDVVLSTTDWDEATRATRVIVDWGDGTPLDPIRWTLTDRVFYSPAHHYAADAKYRVTVTSHYLGSECGVSQSSPLAVTVSALSVEQATWGHVKALYR